MTIVENLKRFPEVECITEYDRLGGCIDAEFFITSCQFVDKLKFIS